jgi:hypothetical protein
MTQYRAVVGIDYPPNKRVEAGEVVSDLPGDSIKWLLEQNLIETLDGKKTTKSEPVVEETPVVKETPVLEETPVVEETPAAEEAPVEEKTETETGVTE